MNSIALISNSESFYRWESEWISWLLSDFEVEHICDPSLSVIRQHVVLVISDDVRGQGDRIEAYIKTLKAAGAKVGVVHLSDEWFVYPTNFYEEAAFVFRSHWRPDVIDGVHCRYLPLGYPNGMASRGPRKPPGQRQYRWSFMGDAKSSRVRMLRAADRISGGFKHLTTKWDDENALGPDDYTRILNDSVFSFCAAGNYTPDTFRMYEALEAGAIPIAEDEGGWRAWAEALWPPSLLRMKPWKERYWRKVARKMAQKSYWKRAYGDAFPLPTLCHWDNLETTLKDLPLDEVAQRVTAWWQDTKMQTRASVADAVRRELITPPAAATGVEPQRAL